MATLVARNDALSVSQVSTIDPTAANNTNYKVSINSKVVADYTSDASGSVQEIVEGLQADLDASTVPEALEATFTENDLLVTATGVTGKPFTLVSSGAGTLTISNTVTVAESPNHWIAKNFGDATALPANGDTVILDILTANQSFKYGLDQNGVTLAALHIRASCLAEIGLPETNVDGLPYFQGGGYRETSLKISATALYIGDGIGSGSKRIKLNLGTNACTATIYRTSANRPSESEAPVHLIGAHASNALHLLSGLVDIGMLPGTGASCTWPDVVTSGGYLRFGDGCTLTTVEAAGNSVIETRSAVTTMRTRDAGKIIHSGAGSIGTLDIDGSKVEVKATGALSITQLNGYGGKELDLSLCDSAVTITNATIYGTPANPFIIRDPNNKASYTNPVSTPNGAQSLLVITGSGKNVRIT